MTVQGTLGSLLQGVSQQPSRIRVDGQVSEQVNMYSDIATGLSSRSGHELISVLSGADADLKFYDLSLKGSNYIVGCKDNTLKIWNTAGQLQTTTSSASLLGYVGTNMRFHVFDDTVYLTNRDTVVEQNDTADGYPFHTVIVSALGGNFTRTYKLDVEFENGSTISASYTTPDGNNAGDAASSTSTHIIQQLKNQVAAASLPAGTTVSNKAEVLLIKSTAPMKATVDDGDAGTILRSMTDTVDDQTYLPKYAPHGTLGKVVGDAAEEDDYYLRYVSDTENAVVGNHFGETGVWEEWFDTTQPSKFEFATMPHVLELGDTGFTLSQGDWEGRRVGDEDSSPMPSFVGNSVRDIGGFESRLVFVAGPNVIMSRTNKPLDFFRKSATVIVDSDPIDMKSTKEGSVTLDWIVPFDKDLILLSDPGDSQFVVTGGGITPKNASLVLTTSFEMFGQARPVTTGRTLIFPFKSGSYSGIKEFFTNDTVSTNGADTLTEVQNKYIPGDVTAMASSKNFNMLLVTTSDEETHNTIWTYKYLWDGQQRLQSSWSKWIFDHDILFMFFDNSTIYFVLDRGEDRTLVKLDMNRPVDDVFDYHLCLDNKEYVTVADNKVTLSYAGAVFVQRTGCPAPGLEIKPSVVINTSSGYEYNFVDPIQNGMELVAGTRFNRYVDPTMPRIKDRSGATVSSAVLTVIKFILHVDDTGEFSTTMKSPYRDDYTFKPSRYPLDDEPLDPNRTMLNTGVFDIPWGERADYSELRIESDDIRPTSILEVEWQAQVTGSRRRV